MQVNVPPSWNILLDDRVSEAFVDRVRDVFHRNGFDRPVEHVRYVEDPAKVTNTCFHTTPPTVPAVGISVRPLGLRLSLRVSSGIRAAVAGSPGRWSIG